MGFAWNQSRCSSFMAAINMAVQGLIQTSERQWSLSKKKEQGKRKLNREVQYAPTLERRKAMLKEGFELVECWEGDFHASPIYLDKKTETFPHATMFVFEALLDKGNSIDKRPAV